MKKYSKGIAGALGGLVTALLTKYLADLDPEVISAMGVVVGGLVTYFSPKNAE